MFYRRDYSGAETLVNSFVLFFCVAKFDNFLYLFIKLFMRTRADLLRKALPILNKGLDVYFMFAID